MMDADNVENVLNRLFTGYRSPDRAAAWEAAEGQFVLGSRVQGIVVARFQFGVFVDINAGFPALLLVTRMRGADRRPYTSMDRYPAIGSALEARVCVCVSQKRHIGLTQLEREPMLDEG